MTKPHVPLNTRLGEIARRAAARVESSRMKWAETTAKTHWKELVRLAKDVAARGEFDCDYLIPEACDWTARDMAAVVEKLLSFTAAEGCLLDVRKPTDDLHMMLVLHWGLG